MTDVGTAVPPPRRAAGPRTHVAVPLVILGVAWGVAVPVLVVQGLAATMTFFGEQATEADHAEQHRHFGLALLVSGAIVLVGIALSVWGRSTGGGRVFGLLLVPALVIAVLWAATAPADPASPAAPSSVARVVCQEHSGGDTRCPGG